MARAVYNSFDPLRGTPVSRLAHLWLPALCAACLVPSFENGNPLDCPAKAESPVLNVPPEGAESWLDLSSGLPIDFELTLEPGGEAFGDTARLFVEWRDGNKVQLWTPTDRSGDCSARAWTALVPSRFTTAMADTTLKRRRQVVLPADPGGPFFYAAYTEVPVNKLDLDWVERFRGDTRLNDVYGVQLSLEHHGGAAGTYKFTLMTHARDHLYEETGTWTSDPPFPF